MPWIKRNLMLVVSGLVALREAMNLFAAEAAAPGVETTAPHFPDFARYDCYACHHDLKVDSWRQRRGFAATPGRPLTPEWPMALVWLGIEAGTPAQPEPDQTADAQGQQLDRLLQDFQSALAEAPFGNMQKAIPAAQAVAEWANGRIEAARTTVVELKALIEDIKKNPKKYLNVSVF